MNEIPDINKRIKELVNEFSAGNVQKFVDLIGVGHQVLNRIFSIDTRNNKYPKPSGLILTAIQTKLPQVNATWLLTGEGEMLNKIEDDLDGNLMVRLKDVDDSYVHAITRLFTEKKIYQSEVVDSLRELVDQLKKENEYLKKEIEALKLSKGR